ncbi:MAG: DUF2179 domain-containing protein [Chloroflexi bacterium]|nr:DUF2179 domain-containing protein [Chloroflexota bacterium]
MEAFFNQGPIVSAIVIFLLRIGDMSLDTIRVLFVVRGKKKLAWILGFFQALIFVVAISSVLANADSWLNILGYAAGFATGNVVGMLIEDRMALGHLHLTIYSSMRGAAIAEALRKDGYGVTEISGRGKDGTVTVLHCSVLRKQVDSVETIVLEEDPSAFITTSDVRQVRRGFWRA